VQLVSFIKTGAKIRLLLIQVG